MATAALQSELFVFFQQLATAPARALFLDYDGTIAPFSVNRSRTFPYAGVPELIDSIMSTCNTRVVVVTGRAIRDLPEFLRRSPRPEIWGVHGLERLLPHGDYQLLPAADDSLTALAEAEGALARAGLEERCEYKPGAVAIHWRGLAPAHIEDVRTRAYRALATIACRSDLRTMEFDGGLELRLRAGNKQHAVRTVLAEMPDDTAAAYLGDDVTDEDAFQEINGRGLSVLVRQAVRATKAQAWIRPPEGLIQFLHDWIRAAGGDV